MELIHIYYYHSFKIPHVLKTTQLPKHTTAYCNLITKRWKEEGQLLLRQKYPYNLAGVIPDLELVTLSFIMPSSWCSQPILAPYRLSGLWVGGQSIIKQCGGLARQIGHSVTVSDDKGSVSQRIFGNRLCIPGVPTTIRLHVHAPPLKRRTYHVQFQLSVV